MPNLSKSTVGSILTMLTNLDGVININGEWEHDKLKLSGPATFSFELKNDQLEIKFEEPHPVASWRFLSTTVPYIRMNLEHVVIGLNNAPDFEIEVH